MTRTDCISNRNIRIVASYVNHKLGHHDQLFENLSYPTERFASPEDFFLSEDEWTTYDNYQRLFRRAKDMVGEPYFYFNCGASSADLRSWGRLDYFVRIFRSPSDGFRRLPFFNRNFNDTKDFEIILPPAFDRAFGKIRTILKVRYHSDIDVEKDYLSDPYRRGILAFIPTMWGLRPATVKQPLNPYNPEVLFNNEPEFSPFALDARIEKGRLTLKHPLDQRRRIVGEEILLEPDDINGEKVFLGRYRELKSHVPTGGTVAILIRETVQVDNRILLKAGEIFRAPYFVLDITYDNFSLLDRFAQIFRIRPQPEDSGKGLVDTINRLRETMEARNRAYHELEEVNAKLIEAKKEVEDHASNLERKVEERTAELKSAKEEVMGLNRDLEAKVKAQVRALKRYDELRRYLSPKLAEKILSAGETLGAEPQRKMMTVMFSDIRNFSAFTDSLEPEELFHLLDRYLSEMTKLIHRYDGTLNKIIGDGMLVFFGDPIPMDDHAQRAVMTAVEMQKKVAALRDEWLQYGHELGIGIGINTGFVTVGNIGSQIHRDYTVIGNQVNVAARLESLAEPGQILISQRTYSRSGGRFKVKKVGEIRVKGIHHPVMTYNVDIL